MSVISPPNRYGVGAAPELDVAEASGEAAASSVRFVTLSDRDRINAPALAGDIVVAAHTPPQHHVRSPCNS